MCVIKRDPHAETSQSAWTIHITGNIDPTLLSMLASNILESLSLNISYSLLAMACHAKATQMTTAYWSDIKLEVTKG